MSEWGWAQTRGLAQQPPGERGPPCVAAAPAGAVPAREAGGARRGRPALRPSHVSLLGLCRVSPDRGRSAGAQRRDDQGTAQWRSAPGFPDAGGDDSSAQGRPVPQPRSAAGELGGAAPGGISLLSAPRPGPGSSSRPGRAAGRVVPSLGQSMSCIAVGEHGPPRSVALIM